MSLDGETSSHIGFDATEHQTTYIYSQGPGAESRQSRPQKRRKLNGSSETKHDETIYSRANFIPLLNGLENLKSVDIRQDLYESCWSDTENQIEAILIEANENTLADVTDFIQKPSTSLPVEDIPTGFIVTGPNIASQGLLFHQLSSHLRNQINGPIVTLRSGDASNLKAVLKRLIKDATNQKPNEDEEEGLSLEQGGRKLLPYDLELLYTYIKLYRSERVVVSIQDSEAFDGALLTDLITLFHSWRDRIPFVLLFGIATSVELFHDRLSRRATRCLFGAQFDVEQTSSIMERVFIKVVISADAPLRLGSTLVSSLMERQYDHVQSVQAFVAALKYAYMCHFYANPLAIFLDISNDRQTLRNILQNEHFEALRNLPSFRLRIQDLLEQNEPVHARNLLEDDEKLFEEIVTSLDAKDMFIRNLLRALHVLASCSKVLSVNVQLFMDAFTGSIYDSGTITKVINAIKRMGSESLLATMQRIIEAINIGNKELGLMPWDDDAADFIRSIKDIQIQTEELIEEANKAEVPIRSKYTAQHKVLRTTVIAQKVQLSHDSSKLSEHDVEFTALVDRFIELLQDYFTVIFPYNTFMHEIWLYDHRSPYRDVFTPRPRFVIERALSAPHEYIDTSMEELSSAKPATALLYEMYLENGSLVNVFDLWSAFSHQMSSDDNDGYNQRETLALFYRALADLKSLGMIKHSKKKTDHLAKLAWKGL